MTPKAYRLLRRLRRTQNYEGNTIFYDLENSIFRPVLGAPDAPENAKERDRSVRCPLAPSDLQETLLYLEQLGYIRRPENSMYYWKITHSGNHLSFVYLSLFVSFVLRSVLIPVLVSAATAIVIHLISRYFFAGSI